MHDYTVHDYTVHDLCMTMTIQYCRWECAGSRVNDRGFSWSLEPSPLSYIVEDRQTFPAPRLLILVIALAEIAHVSTTSIVYPFISISTARSLYSSSIIYTTHRRCSS